MARWSDRAVALGLVAAVVGSGRLIPHRAAPLPPPAAVHCDHAADPGGSGLRTVAGLDQCAVAASGSSSRRLVVQVAPTLRPERELPVAMTVVLDTSGSMSGAKLSEAKAATRALAASLRPGDRLAVVAFASAARTVLPSTAIDELHDLDDVLAEVPAAGGTNVDAGLDAARAVVEASPREGFVHRVVLLSDGEDEDRSVDASVTAALVAAGATLSTAGLGTSVDDLLLSRLAVEGGGTYGFLAEPSAIVARLANELEAARRVVLRDVTVLLPSHAALSIDEVVMRRATWVPDGQLVHLGDLGADPRKVVARVRWWGGTDAAPPSIVIRGLTPGGAEIRQVVPLVVTETADPRVIAASTDATVARLATLAEVGVAFQEATVALRRGDGETARRLALEADAALLDTSGGRDTSSLRELTAPLRNLAGAALDALTPAALEQNYQEIQTRVSSVI